MAGDQFEALAGKNQALPQDGLSNIDWNRLTEEDSVSIKGSVTIPVYYGTDRQWAKGTYNGNRDTSTNLERNQHLEYGTTFVRMPIVEGLPKNYCDLDWQPNDHKVRRPLLEGICRTNEQNFYARAKEICTNADPDEIIVFVPGYKNSFARAAVEAAQISYFFRRPVFLYAWPSVDRYLGYREDQGNAEWSKPHFQFFLDKLSRSLDKLVPSLNKLSTSIDGENFISILSHSMGISLLNPALKERALKAEVRAKVYEDQKLGPISKDPPHFKEIMLVSPDIDREVLNNYWWRVTANSDKIRPWVSDRDKALRLSTRISGYIRAGILLDPRSHKRLPPLPGTETIDFSVVDKPWLPKSLFTKIVLPIDFGHNIPSRQLRNIHDTGEPGFTAKGHKLTLDKTVVGKGRLDKIRLDNGKTPKAERFETPNPIDLDGTQEQK